MYKLGFVRLVLPIESALTLGSMFCQAYPSLRRVHIAHLLLIATRTTQEDRAYTTHLSPGQSIAYQSIQLDLDKRHTHEKGSVQYDINRRKKIMSVTLFTPSEDRTLTIRQQFLDKEAVHYPGYQVEIDCHKRPSNRAMSDVIAWIKHHKQYVHAVEWHSQPREKILLRNSEFWHTLQKWEKESFPSSLNI